MKHIEKTIVIDQKDDSGCVRCGKCCKLLHVRTFDIEKIKKATGLKESEFTELHPFTEKRILKTKCDPVDKDIYCMFLERLDDGTTSCTIYKDRPWLCRLYPYDDICKNERVIHKGVYAIAARLLKYLLTS